MTVVRIDRKQPNTKADEQEELERDYERELRRHKLRRTWTVIVIIVAVLIAAVVISMAQRKTTYSSYKTENSVRRSDAGTAEYIYANEMLFRCSKDGVAAFDNDGNPLWNCTYEINNPLMVTGGSYFAVADLNGNDVYLFSTEDGELGSISSACPILSASVASAGYVAVLVEDDGADYIHMYEMKDEHTKIYTIKKSINIDGLPICMAISPDGEKLVTAYSGVAKGTLDTNLVFSNFDAVGQNENERIVGGYDYQTEMIGKIAFLDSTTVAVLAEQSLDFYRLKEYPEEISKVELDYEIKTVFTGTDYVGLIHTDSENGKDVLEVYNPSGNQVLSWTVAYDDLTTFEFDGDSVVMYGDSHCVILNLSGDEIFNQNFEDGIVELFPIENSEEFIYINADYVEKIRLE